MVDWYWIAKLCGIAPIVAGSGLFAAWATTHHDWMFYTGLLAVPGFLLLIILGFASLGLFVRQSRRAQTPYVRRSLFAAALLLANFPVGAGLTYLAQNIKNIYVIHLLNNTTQPIEIIKLLDPAGQEFPLESLPPQGHAEHQLRFDGEGQVKYYLEIGGTVKTGTLLGYITGGMGGQARLTVETNGRVVVSEQ